MKSKSLISVIGPTAIGKTDMAIAIASHFKTEIISADSRQFYKEMRIGTAVPSTKDLDAVSHHFIQHKNITETYSVGDFERDALLLLTELFIKYDVVVMVGGSGLYVDAVTKGLDLFPKIGPEIRRGLDQILKTKGIRDLQVLLKTMDPEYYEKVDRNNPHRLIRALEICLGSGKPYSSFLGSSKNRRPFKTITVGIQADRGVIYDRIDQRVDFMMDQGFLEEARLLYPHRELNALQTVGYKELFAYFDGVWELDFAVSEIKKNTRRFAKRQLTWFKKDTDIIWVAYDLEMDEMLKKVKKSLNKKNDA